MKKFEEPIVKVMNLKAMDVIATSTTLQTMGANTASGIAVDKTGDKW